MGSVQVSVENVFAIILANWPFLQAFWKHWVYTSPVGRYYHVGVLLTNAIGCSRPNQTSQHFQCSPPSVQEYFYR
jgi:hypothetical protein